MLGWTIVFGILVISTIVLIITEKNMRSDPSFIIFIMLFFALCILVTVSFLVLENKQGVSVFEQQAVYIASHEVADPVENAAITNKKIELNDWLFKAQWSKDKFGIFSCYPDVVLELEPIQ